MSSVRYIYRLTETEIDKYYNEVKRYERDLPHHDMIAKNLTEGWNNLHMERFFNGILKDKIESAIMKVVKKAGESLAIITITGVKGFRLSEKRRCEIFNQVDAQIIDGWGEAFLDLSNFMSDSNGVRFFPE